jgi:hypothetical protein
VKVERREVERKARQGMESKEKNNLATVSSESEIRVSIRKRDENSHVDPSDEMELRLPVPSVDSLEFCLTSNRLGPVPFPSVPVTNSMEHIEQRQPSSFLFPIIFKKLRKSKI